MIKTTTLFLLLTFLATSCGVGSFSRQKYTNFRHFRTAGFRTEASQSQVKEAASPTHECVPAAIAGEGTEEQVVPSSDSIISATVFESTEYTDELLFVTGEEQAKEEQVQSSRESDPAALSAAGPEQKRQKTGTLNLVLGSCSLMVMVLFLVIPSWILLFFVLFLLIGLTLITVGIYQRIARQKAIKQALSPPPETLNASEPDALRLEKTIRILSILNRILGIMTFLALATAIVLLLEIVLWVVLGLTIALLAALIVSVILGGVYRKRQRTRNAIPDPRILSYDKGNQIMLIVVGGIVVIIGALLLILIFGNGI